MRYVISNTRRMWLLITVSSLLFLPSSIYAQSLVEKLRTLSLPPGYTMTLYSDQVPNARQMVWGDKGTLFVGSRKRGHVYALQDRDNDGVAEQVYTVAEGLTMPSGIAFRDGDLYVAAVSRILRYRNIESQLTSPPKAEVVVDDLPTDTHHGWKYLKFQPDGKLIVPVGAPCNICTRRNRQYASILQVDLATGKKVIVAEGVRNSVGFDHHPVTGILWFSDNGSDMLGDDIPPDEINRLGSPGAHFGFPYRYGNNETDPRLGHKADLLAQYQPPALNLPAHVAALGIHFYRGRQFPLIPQQRLLIAEHGSWNRSKKVGYRVMQALVEDGKVTHYTPFVTGWLKNESAWGRPVDVITAADGSVLISDDKAGAIYRVTYQEPQ